jgi:hypothetical protein
MPISKYRRQSWQRPRNPLSKVRPNLGDNKILEDWNRDYEHITIDKKSVLDIVNEERQAATPEKPKLKEKEQPFKTKDELKAFLKKHLLGKLTPAQQEQHIGYIMQSTHQGGFTGSVGTFFYEKINKKTNNALGPEAKTRKTKLDFVTGESGFTVQDTTTMDRLIPTINADEKLYGDGLSADQREKPVLEGTATIAVEFGAVSAITGKPRISVKESTVKYGNKKLEALLDIDERNIFQKFGAWLKEKLPSIIKTKNQSPPTSPDSPKSQNSSSTHQGYRKQP